MQAYYYIAFQDQFHMKLLKEMKIVSCLLKKCNFERFKLTYSVVLISYAGINRYISKSLQQAIFADLVINNSNSNFKE